MGSLGGVAAFLFFLRAKVVAEVAREALEVLVSVFGLSVLVVEV